MRRLFPFFILLLLALLPAHAQDAAPYRFAYISGADKEIWIVNADGSESRQITHDGKGNTTTQTLIAASPDGNYLAYFTDSWYVTGSNAQIPQGPGPVYKLAVLNLHTGERVLLTEQDSFGSAVWSPNSQQLAFASFDAPVNSDYCYHWKAYVMGRDGSNRREIGRGKCSNADLSWSPDGATVLYTAREDGDEYAQLYAMNPDGSNIRRLTHFDRCFICYNAQWTPDSQSIVLYNHPDLFIMQADGSGLRQLTNFEEVYNVYGVTHARFGAPYGLSR